MYLPIPSQRTCVQAWLAAAIAINQAGREAYNVIVDIEEPSARTPADEHIISLMDDFLREHNSPEKTVYPVSSVANTIFPYALLRRHGAPKFYDVYLRVYGHSKKPQDWGRYFHRMIYYKTPDGEIINPCWEMHLICQRKSRAATTAIAEVSRYPDGINGPCMCCHEKGAQISTP
jgi:hypothetical protein